MNIKNLYEIQGRLKERIRYSGPDKLNKLVLAAIVEFAEAANEWRGFKYWKQDHSPNTKAPIECSLCDGTGDENFEMINEDAEGNGGHEYIKCEECDGSGTIGYSNPLLEEYVDGLHFVLEFGLDLKEAGSMKLLPERVEVNAKAKTIEDQFISIVETMLLTWNTHKTGGRLVKSRYAYLLAEYVALGEMLGFTWNDIEDAYLSKNKVNHERQDSGY